MKGYYNKYDAMGEPESILEPEGKKFPFTLNGVEIGARRTDFDAVYDAIDREDMTSFQYSMIGKVFVDLDGTMVDFDGFYETCFGYRPNKLEDNVDWGLVRARPNFYRDIPLFPDALKLWNKLLPYKPTILTGIPSSIPEASANKIACVAEHLPSGTPVICCPSKEKFKHCTPGALLIDDWQKYMDLWTGAGGQWITYTSVPDTLEKLQEIGL
jgi:hypothetical protein